MTVCFTTLLASGTQAGDYYTSVPFLPTVKIGADSEGATPVETVYGKEYSHNNFDELVAGSLDPRLVNIDDHDAFGVADPLQVVSWDGIADAVTGNSGSVDAFDYGTAGFNFPEGQIDALANRGDFLLPQVVRNEASLLFSLTGDLGAAGATGRVHYEDPVGGGGVWAELEIPLGPGPGVNHHRVSDLDALEVWGPEPPSHRDSDTLVDEGYIGVSQTADADRFSLDGDSLSGISVWAYDIPTKFSSPWVLHATIVDAVEALFLGPGETFDRETRGMIDVDGTMARDTGDASPTAALWDEGDQLLFTIDPIDEARIVDATGADLGSITIDGGEIMHLVNLGAGAFDIAFLDHGGHLWDTAFDVSGTFGYEFEDVDALEAVGTLTGDTDIETPEPTAVVLGVLASAFGLCRRSIRG